MSNALRITARSKMKIVDSHSDNATQELTPEQLTKTREKP